MLICREGGRLYAVSERYGGTHVYPNLSDVIRGAYALIRYIEWLEARIAADQQGATYDHPDPDDHRTGDAAGTPAA